MSLIIEYGILILSVMVLLWSQVSMTSVQFYIILSMSLLVYQFHRSFYEYISKEIGTLMSYAFVSTNIVLLWIVPNYRELVMWLFFTIFYAYKHHSIKKRNYVCMSFYFWGWWLLGMVGAQALGLL